MVLFPESFSIRPKTDATVSFQNLFKTAAESAVPKTLSLDKGTYAFLSKNAAERELYITNTVGENEYKAGEVKNHHKIALCLENIKNLEIDGCGSSFVLDGKMTNIAIRNCENITLKNFSIDTVRPNVHKITIIKASPFYATFKIDESSNYCEENGQYYWYGTDYKLGFTDYKLSGWWMATAKPSNLSHLVRNGTHPFSGAVSLKEIAPRVFKVRFISPKDYEPGQVFYLFPTIRTDVGIFAESCKNIKLENINQHFNYSLAFVAQDCENVTLSGVDFSPRDDAEVDFASFADFVQISMCRGNITVENSNFDSAGDDVINVHGFNLKITEVNADRITVKFCHPQSYGYNCFRMGDIIAFVDPKTLLEVGRSKVMEIKKLNPYEFELLLTDRTLPAGVGFVVENISACPDFTFSGNTVNRIVTRGVLVTTRGRVLIENNKFLNTGMSGILIADDASSWYESGPVKNVTIRGNAFMNCDDNAILIEPEVKRYQGAVHENILIENNLFVLNNTHALNVSASKNITMRGNVYRGKPKYGKWIIEKATENLSADCPHDNQ